ncbi:hypothetical protein [Streptomyces sp. NPDC086023]|uniref:hypothetical protein n=1 Tax=Streptomyces sp. NPDC086023 TaxID=3365746 RepID=UPI0037D13A87
MKRSGRRAVFATAALCGALVLTGCKGDGDAAGAPKAPAPGKPAASAPVAPGGTASATPDAKPTAEGKPASTTAPPKAPAGKPKAPATAKPGATPSCDHKMPISPDEIAVYRYTPEGGFLSLIVRHGNWGCGTPDSDGAPFETVGVETFIPLDQAASITVVTPIVESTENQKIGVQEFLDWLEAHPNSGLVFRYSLGKDGAIHQLDQVFTP